MIKKNLAGEPVAEYGLCEGRHEYPVKDCIYPETVQRMNFARLEMTATDVLKPLAEQGVKALVIYVSGCKEAILAAYSAALKLHFKNITVMHYDKLYNQYTPQELAAFNNIMLK